MKTFKKGKRFRTSEITKDIVISFFFGMFFIFIVLLLFEDEINTSFSLVNIITIKESQDEDKLVLWNEEENKIEEYPTYGTSYGTLKIPDLSIEKALYHGDTNAVLAKGLGHYAGSYFPGEGGTILVAGHNTRGFLRTLPNIKVGSYVVIETNYGTFNYEVYDTKVLKATELEEIEIKKDEEELILYTCYPVTIGHPTTRFVVYARRILWVK